VAGSEWDVVMDQKWQKIRRVLTKEDFGLSSCPFIH